MLLAAVCVASSAYVLLLTDHPFVAYAAGAVNATVVWMIALFTIEATGTSSWRMGAMAEQWTAEELRPITRRGARVVHAIGLEWGDVDHVVVAPSGVHAIESKWSSAPWSERDRRSDGRLSRAAEQARENVEKRDEGEARVHAPSRFVDVGVAGVAGDVSAGVAGGIGGFILAGLVLSLDASLWARYLLVAMLLVAGLIARRSPAERVRVAALGFAFGSGVVAALTGGAIAVGLMS